MASPTQKPALSLDTKGLLCPAPVVKTSQAVKQIKVGEILEVLATDPGSKPDLSAWARMTGNDLVDVSEGGDPKVYTFHIRRAR
ncbi:MAG: sulfurtransferase TusA family protein [Nitrososphaerota archaeon]|nr:sulfurtransferase TusA family protein [Nitrososphaerota archaeon]